MIKKIFYAFAAFIFSTLCASAHIDVVYPKENGYTLSAPSVFFIGNTSEGASFTINSEKVKLWDNKLFVHVVPLKYGINTIKMISSLNGIKEEKIYTAVRIKPSPKAQPPLYQPKKQGCEIFVKTIKDYTPVREKPSENAERIMELPKGTGLYIQGRQGKYYRIAESLENNPDKQLWIEKSRVSAAVKMHQRKPAVLKRIKTGADKKYKYIEFYLTEPVFFTLMQKENSLDLTLYSVNVKNSKDTINYTYRTDAPLLGYDAYYEGNTLIFRIAEMPEIKDLKHPLKNISISIDAGHGGDENGAIGPSRVCEKDINLAISRYLEKILKEEGADVFMTRTSDKKTGLYDRITAAKHHNALISVSIHNNALADGKNPYKEHGAEVHYYNENARLLAEIIKNDIAANLNFKDNGIHKSSFVMTRASNPVSVLVECAYMINPEEYMQLIKPEVQMKIAQSIAESLKKYITGLHGN